MSNNDDQSIFLEWQEKDDDDDDLSVTLGLHNSMTSFHSTMSMNSKIEFPFSSEDDTEEIFIDLKGREPSSSSSRWNRKPLFRRRVDRRDSIGSTDSLELESSCPRTNRRMVSSSNDNPKDTMVSETGSTTISRPVHPTSSDHDMTGDSAATDGGEEFSQIDVEDNSIFQCPRRRSISSCAA